ncbi:MAG TPA: DUF72 domain-containing protein [Candidatus Binatia bacterium]|nr:DUF72 domain-containing protein [Candidatus Binatia bacterium]
MPAQLRIGTSGWLYKPWRGGAFYPKGLKQKDEFAHYATLFDTVELNGSFYRLPIETAPTRWREQAPKNFLYAWKYPRWLTHYYKLRDPAESYKLVFGRMRALRETEGPVLFQLHPRMVKDRERLAIALKLLPKNKRVTYEFRHPSWYDEDIFALLRDYDAALCISDHADAPTPWLETASWIYIRGHGPSGRYHGSYTDAALRTWSKHIRAWSAQNKHVFCYFDNDIGAAAPQDALRLKRMLSRPRVRT